MTAAERHGLRAFTAGAANVVMQLSWPEVGYGVAESKVDSGNLLKHPWKRARTTFQYLAVAILGGPDDRAAFREAVDSSHRHVKSTADSPVRYNALTAISRCGSPHAFRRPGGHLLGWCAAR